MKRVILAGISLLAPIAGSVAAAAYVAFAGTGTISSASAAHAHITPALSGHRIWTHRIQPNADSAPAFLAHIRLKDGKKHDLVYVLAGNNTSNCSTGDPVRRATLYALDASNGRAVWTQSTSGPSRCTTAGPVIDPHKNWVYAPGLDGKMHRYDVTSGKESKSQGWPHTISLMPDVEKMSANATMGTGHLYVTTSGFIGDQGHYEGHLVTIDLATGRFRVFNTLCSNIKLLLGPSPSRPNYCGFALSGLFGRGEGAIDPVTHDVYIVTGNGPWDGRTNWGDSVLKLDPSGSRLLDAFTPTNQASLADADADLGSTGPAVLPTIKQGTHSYRLLVQGEKGPACDGCSGVALRLLNRDNLSGRGGPGHLGGDLQDVQTPGSCEVLTAPAVWTSPSHQIWVFYANSCGIGGYRLSSPSPGKFRLDRVWSLSSGGTTPILRNGILFVARSGRLTAYNPTNHAVLWQTNIGDVHWEYPLIASHRLFMTDEQGHISAYALSGSGS